MWPMPRAIGEALVRPVAGLGVVVVAAAPLGVGADGAHLHVAERDLLGGGLRADRDDDRPLDAVALADGPLEHPHAAHRAADDRVPAVDAELRRRARPRARPGRGSWSPGSATRRDGRRGRPTTGRWCPGTRRARWAHDEEAVGVDRAPGPDGAVPPADVAVPGPGGSGGVAVAVSAWSTSTAFDASGASVAPRLVRDGRRLERAAGLELQAVGERGRTAGGRDRRPAATLP